MTDLNSATALASTHIIRTYLITSGLFTLATAMIWGVNTLFLLDAGLDIFGVMVVNGIYSIGQVLFEVPTGVVADTIGRRASFLFGIATLFVSTLLYLASAVYNWGFGGFIAGSVLLGIGYTFQTGAVDAWLIDALDASGYKGRTDAVFARGGIIFGIAMLSGTLAGGFLGQINLAVPYITRSIILAVAFTTTFLLMHDIGFEPRKLRASHFLTETRSIFDAGVRFGWSNPVIKPLLLVSMVQGSFFMYFFYASQPYILDLLGRPDLVWVSGAFAALFGLSSLIGNLCVNLITRTKWGESAPRVLIAGAVAFSILALLAGLTGLLSPAGGSATGFAVVMVLIFILGAVMGLVGPIRQGYINAHIPSKQRATVLSLDSFFSDAGGAMGQPVFGWLARSISTPVTYIIGGVITSIAAPLYKRSGRNTEIALDVSSAVECARDGTCEPIESVKI